MKKLLLPICIIALALLLFSAVKDKAPKPEQAAAAPRVTSVSEAAFSMRSSGSEDATSRLVGNFRGEDGEKLVFNGKGELRRVSQNLSMVTGSYQLLQSADGAAILDMELDGGGKALYSFAISSPEGNFTLTDGNGAEKTFVPIPY